jgi:hypothetical protein
MGFSPNRKRRGRDLDMNQKASRSRGLLLSEPPGLADQPQFHAAERDPEELWRLSIGRGL